MARRGEGRGGEGIHTHGKHCLFPGLGAAVELVVDVFCDGRPLKMASTATGCRPARGLKQAATPHLGFAVPWIYIDGGHGVIIQGELVNANAHHLCMKKKENNRLAQHSPHTTPHHTSEPCSETHLARNGGRSWVKQSSSTPPGNSKRARVHQQWVAGRLLTGKRLLR